MGYFYLEFRFCFHWVRTLSHLLWRMLVLEAIPFVFVFFVCLFCCSIALLILQIIRIVLKIEEIMLIYRMVIKSISADNQPIRSYRNKSWFTPNYCLINTKIIKTMFIFIKIIRLIILNLINFSVVIWKFIVIQLLHGITSH